ncbi:hypothetical protein BDZ45DRAFT_689250 [Acephala macrosclerotiorum]|nr:hypothetical protein BDZ45DRAFT_689250 [Acephala macrosclerotiorum]
MASIEFSYMNPVDPDGEDEFYKNVKLTQTEMIETVDEVMNLLWIDLCRVVRKKVNTPEVPATTLPHKLKKLLKSPSAYEYNESSESEEKARDSPIGQFHIKKSFMAVEVLGVSQKNVHAVDENRFRFRKIHKVVRCLGIHGKDQTFPDSLLPTLALRSDHRFSRLHERSSSRPLSIFKGDKEAQELRKLLGGHDLIAMQAMRAIGAMEERGTNTLPWHAEILRE